jgi:ubiquinone/menaquinone biosynthesis C-methylase UbiE
VDAETYRAESREKWERAAAGWEGRRTAMQRDTHPVAVWLVEHVRPQPGHRVLEVAAGVGDTGLLAAELVRPGGTVLITDGAEAMVAAARRRADELGVPGVETRAMEAEWLDLPTASVDGVLCRWGYMLLADPAAGLREARRVLRPGGRIALAAWTDPAANPWFSAIGLAMGDLGLEDARRPDAPTPGPFAFSAPGTIEALLEEAGFAEPLVEPLDFTFRFASPDEHFEQQLDLSANLRTQVDALSPADRYRLRDAIDARLAPHVGAGGSLELPARTWVASADA